MMQIVQPLRAIGVFAEGLRLLSLGALRADKSEVRDDSTVAAKDRADLATLSGFG